MSLLERFRIYFKQLPTVHRCLLVLAFVIVIIVLAIASTFIIIAHTIVSVGSGSAFASLDNAPGELNFSSPSLNSIYELAEEVGSYRPPTHELSELQERNEICLTTECQTLAKDFLNSVDFTVDPCADFYEFTCGQILSNGGNANLTIDDAMDKRSNQPLQDLLEELTNLGDDDDEVPAVTKARDFYNTCLNQSTVAQAASIQLLRAVVESNGGWPLLMKLTDGGTFDESNFDWVKVSAAYDYEFRSSAFLSVTVELDIKQPNQHIICIEQPDLRRLEYISSYTIARVLKHLSSLDAKFWEYSIYSGIEDKITTQNEQELADMTAFMEKLLSITDKTKSDLPKYSHEYLEYTYNKYSVVELGREIGLDLKSYIEHAFRARLDWQWQPAGEQIIVRVPSYLKQLIPLIQMTEKTVLANVLHFFMADKLLTEMDSIYGGAYDYVIRKYYCKYETLDFFILAASYKTSGRSRENITNDDNEAVASISAVDGMIENQRNVFLEQITNSGFDSITVNNARARLIALKTFVGSPTWLTRQMVEDYYQELNVIGSANTSHLVNLRNSNTWYMGKRVKLLRAPVEKDIILEAVLTHSLDTLLFAGYYFPARVFGTLVIPASLLRKPVFCLKYPASINYGALGHIIAHELSHGLEHERNPFEGTGGMTETIPSVSTTARNEYNRRAECFKNQYEEFEPLPDEKINATYTISEDIADNTGIHIALSAYQKYFLDTGTVEQRLPGLEQFTPEQLFFIAFAHTWCDSRCLPLELSKFSLADSYSPAKFRILGSLMNSHMFSNVWSCPSGSKMNPSKKCKMW